jgi:hypothetical protein
MWSNMDQWEANETDQQLTVHTSYNVGTVYKFNKFWGKKKHADENKQTMRKAFNFHALFSSFFYEVY